MIDLSLCVVEVVCKTMCCTFSWSIFACLSVMQCVPEITIALSIEVIDQAGWFKRERTSLTVCWPPTVFSYHPTWPYIDILCWVCELSVSTACTCVIHVQHKNTNVSVLINAHEVLSAHANVRKLLVRDRDGERNADHPVDQHCCGECLLLQIF